MNEWINTLPLGWMAIVIFTLTYFLTWIIHAVIMKFAVEDRAIAFKSVSAGMLPPLGIVFGLFVAFIASQVWSDIDRANTAVNREASALSLVVFLAANFPGEPEGRLRGLIRQHIDDATTQEWPMMAKHSASLRITSHPLAEALIFTLALEPHSEGQKTAQREIVTALENALDARRQRITISYSQVNWVKFSCLLLQAIVTLIAIAMVHSGNRTGSAFAMGIFSTGVAVSIFLIAAHNRPFGGSKLSIGSQPLQQIMPEDAASQTEFDHSIALNLTTLLGSAREVISNNQALINKQGTGKQFTAAKVIQAAKGIFNKKTGHDLPVLDPASVEGKMLQAEIMAIEEVMTEAQPLINDPKRGFKGFLPAVFTYRVAERFSQKMGGLAYLKLTAPIELIRRQSNSPDNWEDQMIKVKFQSPSWKKGQFVGEEAELNGRKAYRLLIPEYYDSSCLACHGEPKGAKDISGGIKEGGKLGELGGAISVAIYLK